MDKTDSCNLVSDFCQRSQFWPRNQPNTLTKLVFLVSFYKISFQYSNAKSSHCIRNLRPYYKSKKFPCLILCFVAEILGIQKYVKIWCQHFDLNYSISSVKFQVVSGLELQLFDTMDALGFFSPGVVFFTLDEKRLVEGFYSFNMYILFFIFT